MGLRSTRATARQLEVSDGGTSNVSEPESLRKTHLTSGLARGNARRLAHSIPGRTGRFHPVRIENSGIHEVETEDGATNAASEEVSSSAVD